jgi:hypothetical protein
MYSPKIAEELIPVLYRTAKAQGQPMTKLVNKIIREALFHEVQPQRTQEAVTASTVPTDDVRQAA